MFSNYLINEERLSARDLDPNFRSFQSYRKNIQKNLF